MEAYMLKIVILTLAPEITGKLLTGGPDKWIVKLTVKHSSPDGLLYLEFIPKSCGD